MGINNTVLNIMPSKLNQINGKAKHLKFEKIMIYVKLNVIFI